jgi:hypothetical protein
MTDRALDLLADLARLMKRYGPGEFLRLAEMLADPTLVESLRRTLVGAARLGPKRPEKDGASILGWPR